MSDTFRDRETQFEAKFAHDEELKFKIVAHRNKLFAAWVAEQMGAAAPAGYADSLLQFAFGRTAIDLVAKAAEDLQSHGLANADIKTRKALEELTDRSEHEVMSAEGEA
jgi:hypothetical protein